MAQTLNLTYGRVKFTAGQPKQTQYGMRINVVVTLPDGEELKLWGDPGDPALSSLTKGQQVQLAQNAKGNWQLVQQQQSQESPPQQDNGNGTAPTGWTPEEKRAIASRVEEKAKLMKFCLEQARKHCGEYLESSEDLRAVAIVLFGEAVSK
jgi:hypothetical protein